jgi:fatty acid desaturase
MFCWTSCFHECAHQTLCSSPAFSIWLGRVLGTLITVPYGAYRETHIRHHAYLNKPSDWELWPYSDPTTSVGFRRVWAWLDLFLGTATTPYAYGRIFWSRRSPLKDASLRRTIRTEYAVMLAIWISLLTFLTLSGAAAWWGFLKVWWIPVSIASFLQTGRKFTEHIGMPSYDPLFGTRTVVGDNWMTKFGTFCNFDIFVHGPHHRHPRLSHDRLGRKMREYVSANPEREFPIFPTYRRAIAAMIPHLLKNPGVGMNAGAAEPSTARDADVGNFVADVTAEVLHAAENELTQTRDAARC